MGDSLLLITTSTDGEGEEAMMKLVGGEGKEEGDSMHY